MQWGPRFALFVFLILLPLPALAQVVIDEIMYNPEGSDAGREWIELYNEGQSDVAMVAGSGKASWRVSDGSNHTLTDPASGVGRGTLTIPAGGYLIVASDPTDFVSGDYASGTYSVVKASMSLNNSGGTISLLDGNGATVDSVSYSPSQGGSDDGSSLQRQQDGSWIAALPTPGVANSNVAYSAPPPTDASDSSAAASASSTDQNTGEPVSPPSGSPTSALVDSYVPPPAPSLYADAGGNRTVVVGADVEFDASAYDKMQILLDPSTVRFMWNFGDGTAAEGSAVLHHFSYPGRYAVVLDIADDKNAAIAEIEVDAQPAALAFSLLPDGGVGVENLAGHDLDLSGWVVRENAGAFASQFLLPQHSKLLAGSSLQISPQTLAFRASSSTMLEYPNGSLAIAMGQRSGSSTAPTPTQPQGSVAPVAAEAATGAAPVLPKPAPPQAAPATTPAVADANPGIEDATNADPVDPISDATATILQTASAASATTSNYLWWLGVIALAGAVAAAAIAARFFKKSEWGAVEDTGP